MLLFMKPLLLAALLGARLIIMAVLRGKWGCFVVVLAIVCSSWVPASRGSTGRCLLVPQGNVLHKSVRDANKMVSRTWIFNTGSSFCEWNVYKNLFCLFYFPGPLVSGYRSVLIMMLVTCCGGKWLTENPGQTLLQSHFRFCWMSEQMLSLYRGVSRFS